MKFRRINEYYEDVQTTKEVIDLFKAELEWIDAYADTILANEGDQEGINHGIQKIENSFSQLSKLLKRLQH